MDLFRQSASAMLHALRSGEVSSVELVRAHHARADEVEGQVRAFTEQHREQALAAAAAADASRARGDARPLLGLPMTIKENLAWAGTPATIGVARRLQQRATQTAPVVQAVLDAGAVVLGKTNVPQLLLAMETHNDIWGTTHNPWDLGRVPGGSSGGEAAAIAAGMSPAGVGTDIGGSIRIPAAWCGVCGLKPTWGRWSVYGSAGGQPGQEAVRAQSGPIARTVEDVRMLMEVLTPPQHELDPLVPPWPVAARDGVKGLRVGIYEDDGVFRPSPAIARGLRAAADALAAAGADVVPYAPPRSWDMVATYFGLLSADGTRTARDIVGDEPVTPQLATLVRLARTPAPLRRLAASVLASRGETRVAAVLRVLGEKRVSEAWALTVQRDALKRAELEAWATQGLDLVLGPPTVTPAALLGQTHDWSLGAWNTMRFNLLDLPAGVVPTGVVRDDEATPRAGGDRLDRKAATFEAGSAGLPVAAQVIGRPWEEELVLAAMQVIEDGLRDVAPTTPVDPPRA